MLGFLLPDRCRARTPAVEPSGLLPNVLCPEQRQQHDHEDHADPDRAPDALAAPVRIAWPLLPTTHRRHQCDTSPCASWVSSMTGGMVKVWWGAGEGTVHSRPRAPSHTRSVAFFLAKNTVWTITATKINWLAPNMKPPMELIMLKSAKAKL